MEQQTPDGRTLEILDILQRTYPDARCELNYTTPFELLVAVILSAQCTDKRVNVITEKLFKRANTPRQILSMPDHELISFIRSAGFFNEKAKSIKNACLELVTRFNDTVPCQLSELRSIKGVGPKSANVVFSVAFNGDAIPVDTHVARVSLRLNLASANTPAKIEKELNAAIPKNRWSSAHHLLIFHGRYTCKARRPLCASCPLTALCNFNPLNR